MKCPQVVVAAAFLAFVCLNWKPTFATQKSYHGYSVYQIEPQTQEHLRSLQSLAQDKRTKLQFWSRPVAANRTVELLVGPRDQKQLYEKLKYWLLPAKKTIPNVQRLIRSEQNHSRQPRRATISNGRRRLASGQEQQQQQQQGSRFFESFQSYPAIETKLHELTKLYPSQSSLSIIGHSTEGRKLYLVKVGSKALGGDSHNNRKPVIFIDAGHHAREWASHSTGLYLLESLLNQNLAPTKWNKADRITRLDLESFDYWFVPVVNPDGYEYSRTKDRMWRKTRSRPSTKVAAACSRRDEEPLGVDPNRNYPVHWRGKGTSDKPCEEIYAGSRALSEPETAAIARVLRENRDRIVMYLTLHTYGQVILAPYGYDTGVKANNFDEHREVAMRFVDQVAKLRGTRFQFGQAAELMGTGAGGSDDFAKGDAGIRFSFTIELPDKGQKGFMLPASQIVPVGHETLIGLRAMTDKVKEILQRSKSATGGRAGKTRAGSNVVHRTHLNKSSF